MLLGYGSGTVQYRKWSPTASDPETSNDPRPQVIPKVDRKWSRENLRNGLDWLQKRADYKKETFFSCLLKKKGRRTLHLRSIYTRWKKNWINLKSMVLTVYFFLCRLLQFSFKNVSSFEKFKTGRTLRRKNSIILTPRSSTFLLRNTKLGTLYITRPLLTLVIFMKAWN